MSPTQRKLFWSYALDVATLVGFTVVSLAFEFLPPVEHVPDRNDKSISFPFTTHEIIPSIALPMFNMGIPTLVILCCMSANRFKNKRLFVAIMGLYLSVSLAFLLTNVLKGPIGRLRPDFLSRCILDELTGKCTGDPKRITEGRRSFPSGHASSTFGGMVFTALFLAGQLKVFDGAAHIYKLVIFLLPILVAMLVSASRIVDHRHHWDDVVAGSFIGIISAASSYFFYFPALTSLKCDSPRDVRFTKLEQSITTDARYVV